MVESNWHSRNELENIMCRISGYFRPDKIERIEVLSSSCCNLFYPPALPSQPSKDADWLPCDQEYARQFRSASRRRRRRGGAWPFCCATGAWWTAVETEREVTMASNRKMKLVGQLAIVGIAAITRKIMRDWVNRMCTWWSKCILHRKLKYSSVRVNL